MILCPADEHAVAAMAARTCWQASIQVLNVGEGDPNLESEIDAVVARAGADPSPDELLTALRRAGDLGELGNRLARVIW